MVKRAKVNNSTAQNRLNLLNLLQTYKSQKIKSQMAKVNIRFVHCIKSKKGKSKRLTQEVKTRKN
jgi:hypothetical protein